MAIKNHKALYKLYIGLNVDNSENTPAQQASRKSLAIELASVTAGLIDTGLTVFDTNGYWDGKPEPSIVIEIMAAKTDMPRIELLAQSIKTALSQNCVLITMTQVRAAFIS